MGGGEEGERSHLAEGIAARKVSSRVPASGEQQGASRGGGLAVRCQLMGQYGASG